MTKTSNAAPFAALDLGDLPSQMAEQRAKVGRIEAAIEAAQEQRQEIGRKRHEIREAERDGSKVADALLADPASADGLAAMLAPDMAALDAEFEALGAGLRELRARLNSAALRLSELEAEVFAVISEAARPLVAAISAQAAEHAAGLVQAFADLSALSLGTRAGTYEADRLRRTVGQMLRHVDPIIPWRKTAQVSSETASALDRLADMVPSLPIAVTKIALLP